MKQLTQDQIDWSYQYLENWNLNSEGKVDVNGDVHLDQKKFKRFPVSFGTVTGYFACSRCASLESLEGAPETVNGNFNCYNCTSLISLEGAPETVKGSFNCDKCKSLESLHGAPKTVSVNFTCEKCTSLKTLEGAPKTLGEIFYCRYCTSLPAVQHDIIDQYNDDKITWEEAYKILHTPVLLQAKDLGIL